MCYFDSRAASNLICASKSKYVSKVKKNLVHSGRSMTVNEKGGRLPSTPEKSSQAIITIMWI